MTENEERRSSPFVELIGGRMEEWREGYVRMSLAVQPHHTNPHGVMHGGVITTLMDEALGGVIASVRGMEVMRAAPHATVDMSVSFLAAARRRAGGGGPRAAAGEDRGLRRSGGPP